MASEGAARGFGRSRIGWEFFGKELKRCREAAGLSQDELGRLVFCSGSYIGQFENGTRKPQPDLAKRLDTTLGTSGILGRMCDELINNPLFADYFAGVVDLQELATTISEYSPLLVPGLLQTAAYARAVFRAANPFQAPELTEEWIETRLKRARLLDGPNAPEYWAILDESVLRRPVGTDAEWAEQLDHIAERTQTNRLLLQVLPFASREHALLEGSMVLMTFSDAPPLVYTESAHSGHLIDDPAMVTRCQTTYDLARAAALPPKASLSLIQSVAKEYR